MAKTPQKRIRYRDASVATLRKAWSLAINRLIEDGRLESASSDAGFIIEAGTKPKTGFQVFVKVSRYDESLLRSHPVTGGLLERNR